MANEVGLVGLGYNVIFGDDLRKPALSLISSVSADRLDFDQHKIQVFLHRGDQGRRNSFEDPQRQHSMLYVKSSRRGHFDKLGSCICLDKGLQSPGQRAGSHREAVKDVTLSSDQSDAGTFRVQHKMEHPQVGEEIKVVSQGIQCDLPCEVCTRMMRQK